MVGLVNMIITKDVINMLGLVDEGAESRIDQCSITLKMVDGSCILGSMGITRKEFEELWERFIDGRV